MNSLSQHNRKLLCLVFLLGCVCSVARHSYLIDSPFVLGRAGELGGRFQGAIQESWEQGGFFALEARPILWPVPTEPVTGKSYVHHPLLFHYVERIFVWHFGLTEFALRIYPALGAAITCGFLALLAFKKWRWWGFVVATLLQLLSDGMFYYGSAANYDSTVTTFIVGGLVAEQLLNGRKRLFWIFLCSFLGIGHEWSGGLLVFGLVGLMAARKRFDWPVVFSSLLGCALYVGLHLSAVAYWEGGFRRAIEIMLMASDATGASEMPLGFGEFLLVQVKFFSRMWGYCSIPLLIAPLVLRRFMAEDMEFLKQNAFCWIPIYVTWVGLFSARSWNHEGWCYLVHTGVLLGQTSILCAIFTNAWSRHLKIPVSIGVAMIVFVGLWAPLENRLTRIEKGDVVEKAKGINAIVTATDFVVTSRWTGPLYFYLNCSTFDTGPPAEELDELIKRFRLGEFPNMKRFILVIDRGDRDTFDRADFERRNVGFHFHREIEADLYFLSRP